MFNKLGLALTLIISTVLAMLPAPVMAAVDTVALQAEADAFKTDALAVAAIIGLAFMAAAFGFVIYKWIRGAIFG